MNLLAFIRPASWLQNWNETIGIYLKCQNDIKKPIPFTANGLQMAPYSIPEDRGVETGVLWKWQIWFNPLSNCLFETIPTCDTYLDICRKGIASKALVCLDLDSQLRLDKRKHWIFCLVFASFIIWSQYWAYMDYSPHLILRFQVGDRSIGIRKTIHDVCTVVQDMLKEVEAQVIF